MYVILQIIVEHTHLVISQYAHDVANNGRVHTSTYTTIMSIYAHTFSVKPGEKNDHKVSLFRRTFKGTNITFLFSLSLSIYPLQYADLAQPDMRSLCELVGTLNV